MNEVQSIAKALKKSTHKAIQKLHLRSVKQGFSEQQEQRHDPVDREISFDHYVAKDRVKKDEGFVTGKSLNSDNSGCCRSILLEKKDIVAALPVYFPEESTVVVCRNDGIPCMSQNYPISREQAVSELQKILETVNLGDRDGAIREGLMFMGKRFEIFQFHPPLVYGRMAGVPVKESVGIVVVRHAVGGECALMGDSSGEDCYLIVTYGLPETSAHILCQAKVFCSKFL